MKLSERSDDKTEKELIKRWKRGDKRAFGKLVKLYMKRAYFLALGLMGNRDDALDLSQEAFIRAYKHREIFYEDMEFFPWYYQILRNLCFNALKSRRNHQFLDFQTRDLKSSKSGKSFDPEVIAERDDVKEKVWKAVGSLSSKHREIIILRHFQELSYEQIAALLSCSKGTVMSRLYYARQALKEKLSFLVESGEIY